MSPGTTYFALIVVSFPSLRTVASCGIKLANWAIISADLEVCAYEKQAVTQTTTASTTPRYKLV